MNRFILLFLFVCVAALLSAQSYVYWCEEGSIMYADINNPTVANVLLTNTTANFLAANSTYVYWSWTDIDTRAGYIGRAKLDGSESNPMFITGCTNPAGLAVNDTYIYWANMVALKGTQAVSNVPVPTNFTIGRATINGEEINQSFISIEGLVLFGPLAINATYLFWGGYISTPPSQQSPLPETTQDVENKKTAPAFIFAYQLAAPNTLRQETIPLAVDALAATDTLLFACNPSVNSVGYGKIENPGDLQYIEACEGPSGLAVNSTYLFWTNLGQSPGLSRGPSIGRASVSGDTVSEIDQYFITNGCITPYSPACSTKSPTDPYNSDYCGAVGLEFVLVFAGLALLRKIFN